MKYIKVIYKCLSLLVISCVLIVIFSCVFSENKNIKTKLSSIPKNSLDIIFLGSSHVQYGINPVVINKFTSLYSYVGGSPCQPMEVSYEMIKESLKYQKPKLIVVEAFSMLPARNVCMADDIYKVASDEMRGLQKYKTLLNISDKSLAFDYIFDLRIHHQRWSEMEAKDLKFNFSNLPYDDFGYVNLKSKDLNYRYLEAHERVNTYKLEDKSVDYLKKIKKLCDDNNIQLLLIKTPFDIDQENYDYLMSVWDLADELNIKYVDLISKSKEIDFAFGVDSETWHNTIWGSYKNSKYLSKYIMDNFKFNHKENKEVEKNLSYLNDSTLYSLLDNMVDPYRYISYASEFDSIVLLKYKGAKKSTIGKKENEVLNKLGLDYNFIWNKNLDYYAIIKNGKVLAAGNKGVKEIVNGKEIIINKNLISINNKIIEDTEGELSIVVLNNDMTWHHVMNVNHSTRWFWKNGCIDWKCE